MEFQVLRVVQGAAQQQRCEAHTTAPTKALVPLQKVAYEP